MATVDDVEVANASFPNVRQDLNDILEAITTNFSADTEPTTTYPNQFWYETDTNLLYIRNEADDAWITLASINQTTGEWEPRTAVIQAIDSAGIALKTDDGTTRFSISDAGVVSFENYSFPSADGTDGQVLTTDGAGNLTFEDGGAGDKIEEGNSSVEVVDSGTGHVAITTDGSEAARIDSSQRVLIGTTSSRANGQVESQVQVEGLGGNASAISITRNSNNASPPYFIFAKSRGTADGGVTVIQDGDTIGRLRFAAADGTDTTSKAADIDVEIDGTPGSNDVPARIVFKTASDGAESSTERMRIDSSGDIFINRVGTIGGNDAQVHIEGGQTALNIYRDTSSDGAGVMNWYSNVGGSETQVGQLEANGDIETATGSYGSFSDQRLKQDIVDSASQWDDIKALQVKKYRLIKNVEADGDNAPTMLGVIAQDLEAAGMNGLVKNKVNEATGEEYKSVKYSILYMKAVKALQEAMDRIETLESKVDALENQ